MTITHTDLTQWFFDTFVADQNSHALMNPPGVAHKYSRRDGPLTVDMIAGAFNGETRRVRVNDKFRSTPNSFAAIPQNADGAAKHIILDVDEGGEIAVRKLLDVAQSYGLWAFAQLSESATHRGGHVWIVGGELLPTPMLSEIGQRIAFVAGIACEVWPRLADLRLPLMAHLRAPGGPRRFPLLLPNGLTIDASPAWVALERLQLHCQSNPPESLTAALGTLPALPTPEKIKQARHKSDVNPGNVASVIAWYKENFSLRELLERSGAQFKTANQKLVICPFHDDHDPSLAIFRHNDGHEVCHCFSTNSNCLLADGPYNDAFNLYCLTEDFTPSEAVKTLVQKYNLGQKTETKIELIGEPKLPAPVAAMAAHQAKITEARTKLTNTLEEGAIRGGRITVVGGVAGIGKTTAAAKLATQRAAMGETVVIAAPTLTVAQDEWATRIEKSFVWRSKVDLCACHDRKFLQLCSMLGYRLPDCTDDFCPFALQKAQSANKIIIYQHSHLHLKNGEKMLGANLVIVDENPINTLSPEKFVAPSTIKGFVQRFPTDPATPLLGAIQAAMTTLPKTMVDTRGQTLTDVIQKFLDRPLLDAIKLAQASPHNRSEPRPPDEPGQMFPQFLHGLLNVLANAPGKLSYGRIVETKAEGIPVRKWGLVWHERKELAAAALDSMFPPAVIVLDGSADREIYEKLLAPRPINFVSITCPLSPFVEVIQITCTGSTRSITKEQRNLDDLARQIAHVCNKLSIVLDGGVCYNAACETFQAQLGGVWLHYGGQRGHNELTDARAIGVIASPTVPPAAIERRALALWPDLQSGWTATGVVGAYVATDARLQAMHKLAALEELSQAIYRARPVTATSPMKILIFTPWDLSAIGIEPNQIVTTIQHGNHSATKHDLRVYQQNAGRGGDRAAADLNPSASAAQNDPFPIAYIYSNSEPAIGNDPFCAGTPDVPPIGNDNFSSVPSMAPEPNQAQTDTPPPPPPSSNDRGCPIHFHFSQTTLSTDDRGRADKIWPQILDLPARGRARMVHRNVSGR